MDKSSCSNRLDKIFNDFIDDIFGCEDNSIPFCFEKLRIRVLDYYHGDNKKAAKAFANYFLKEV